MPIQFTCSNCQNPIEVDDEFAEQMATCPYCRAVLKVPSATTLEEQQPVTARPVDPQLSALSQRPPLPGDYPQYNEPTVGGVVDPTRLASARNWGYSSLALAMLTLVLGFAYYVALFVQAAQAIPGIENVQPGDIEMQQKLQAEAVRIAQTQTMVIASFGTFAFAIAGIIAALVGLAKQATWQAITGLVISLMGFSCLSCLSLGFVSQSMAPNSNSGPSGIEEKHPDSDSNTPAADKVARVFGEVDS